MTTIVRSRFQLFRSSINFDYLVSWERQRSQASAWLKRNPQHKLLGVNDDDRRYIERRIERSLVDGGD